MQLFCIIFAQLLTWAWVAYALFPAIDIVPADSVGAGSNYLMTPGWCLALVSLIATLLPCGLFSPRNLIRVAAVLIMIAILITPWLYVGREPANARSWLHSLTIACIVFGTTCSYSWKTETTHH